MYWIFATETQNESQAQIFGRPEVIKQLGLSFNRGLPITTKVPEIEIKVSPADENILTDNLIAKGTKGLVFNSKLREAISNTGVDNIEYFDVAVLLESSGKIIRDYKMANIVGRIDCIDPTSELQRDDDGSIEFIDKLILDESKIHGALMFRLAEFLSIVIVHENVKQAVEAGGFTGINFYQPEDYVL
ncbi:MAG: hypothetical protein JW841_08725 [Deltaproteobacteria bacterium]|nr:hypothetical protein [Deltaproteobacteria bacterium]